ncbi:branched-chain amino acid ABC transporter ATP-binding protein [Variovorax sp. WS11]|uniref:ABC transporter ATP-binding protein n=1 Tax=Variovorax sp. WS11 TaxID=1105204 RepID=UPI000D0DE216|nr:ABC transporter ATP-binding protein [Variovorax sp. WS11]NDZ17547.1 ABC transporter ATP-binding protein [Variovorax sp. WS11]PSL82247.1 branched-chain amino acid ABC transporter ATP-binding protein [Variovorax sp. WS11]
MLSITNFRGGYYKGASIFDCISLDLRDHAITSIVGSNGAGKSTILRGVCGLLPWHAGEVQFDGERIDGLAPHEIARRGVRMVVEGRGTFSGLSVLENLNIGGYRLSAAHRKGRVERELVRFPRLRERLSQTAGMLSGGEQQMLAIARAMMADPRILILDEPSQGLAPIIVDQLFDLFPKLARDGTQILLVEQDVGRGLEVSQHAIVIEKGRIKLEGSSADLLEDPRVQEAFLGLN